MRRYIEVFLAVASNPLLDALRRNHVLSPTTTSTTTTIHTSTTPKFQTLPIPPLSLNKPIMPTRTPRPHVPNHALSPSPSFFFLLRIHRRIRIRSPSSSHARPKTSGCIIPRRTGGEQEMREIQHRSALSLSLSLSLAYTFSVVVAGAVGEYVGREARGSCRRAWRAGRAGRARFVRLAG